MSLLTGNIDVLQKGSYDPHWEILGPRFHPSFA